MPFNRLLGRNYQRRRKHSTECGNRMNHPTRVGTKKRVIAAQRPTSVQSPFVWVVGGPKRLRALIHPNGQALSLYLSTLLSPTRLKTVLQVGTVIGVPQSSCVLMLATVYPYLGKKDKHLGTVGVREEGGGEA
jgi:hypothetical protein